jgi:hypothetical protein
MVLPITVFFPGATIYAGSAGYQYMGYGTLTISGSTLTSSTGTGFNYQCVTGSCSTGSVGAWSGGTITVFQGNTNVGIPCTVSSGSTSSSLTVTGCTLTNTSNPVYYAFSDDGKIATCNSSGTVDTSSTGDAVTIDSGNTGQIFNTSWAGSITVNGIVYTISSVSSTSALTLTTSPGNNTAVPYTYYGCHSNSGGTDVDFVALPAYAGATSGSGSTSLTVLMTSAPSAAYYVDMPQYTLATGSGVPKIDGYGILTASSSLNLGGPASLVSGPGGLSGSNDLVIVATKGAASTLMIGQYSLTALSTYSSTGTTVTMTTAGTVPAASQQFLVSGASCTTSCAYYNSITGAHIWTAATSSSPTFTYTDSGAATNTGCTSSCAGNWLPISNGSQWTSGNGYTANISGGGGANNFHYPQSWATCTGTLITYCYQQPAWLVASATAAPTLAVALE